ncbi:hypothetical protein EV10_0051 [Prochlorococcus marinus str. SS51]|uniref:Uncharacterized protein n=1 Tax=Prochlorococcus marinus (strain SARG / CCMP1375 / SS120) TaxID=167539 RepID=Q7VDU2_PROMA|nr:Predicted protein [Prochlorococcus marinus subsp. marinus str. CCMP1375]KGG11406.1 hypothetical protein EV04_1485 [Prochlorococcus marinus str. LG]KGG22911.1 hypothetical protein EV09_1653 [Prochlorococcus marinus str. SS35]KGG34015.1 hypothetical protein EV10_0051 [Prochlorococcus marinus str. SS51]
MRLKNAYVVIFISKKNLNNQSFTETTRAMGRANAIDSVKVVVNLPSPARFKADSLKQSFSDVHVSKS